MLAVVLLLIGLALHSCWRAENEVKVVPQVRLLRTYTPPETIVYIEVETPTPEINYYYSQEEYQRDIFGDNLPLYDLVETSRRARGSYSDPYLYGSSIYEESLYGCGKYDRWEPIVPYFYDSGLNYGDSGCGNDYGY